MRTFLDYLPKAGDRIKSHSIELVDLYRKKQVILKELAWIDGKIKDFEKECYDLVKTDWTKEEILQARKKARGFNDENKYVHSDW